MVPNSVLVYIDPVTNLCVYPVTICVYIHKVRDDGAPTPRPHPPRDGDSVVEESITVEEEYKRNLRCIKERWKNIPDKFKGFEALLESDSEDDETIPSGIK